MQRGGTVLFAMLTTSVSSRSLPILLGAMLGLGCAATTAERNHLPELRTVPHVDVSKYVGTWYEIASYPQRFQEGCTGTTATYTPEADGNIRVLNRCFKPTLDGEEDIANGRAKVVDPKTNAKLEVSFFRPFWGDYWIVELGDNYEYAAVGHPSRDYLWILSRSPQLDDKLYESIVERLEKQGFDRKRLRRTLQKTSPVAVRQARDRAL